MKVADYVLSKFSKEDEPIVEDAIKKSCDAVEAVLIEKVFRSNEQFNGA